MYGKCPFVAKGVCGVGSPYIGFIHHTVLELDFFSWVAAVAAPLEARAA
jgi:hypothetical protein